MGAKGTRKCVTGTWSPPHGRDPVTSGTRRTTRHRWSRYQTSLRRASRLPSPPRQAAEASEPGDDDTAAFPMVEIGEPGVGGPHPPTPQALPRAVFALTG